MGSLRLGDLAKIKLKLNIETADTSQDTYLDELNGQISFEAEQFILGDNVVGLRTSGGPPVPDLVEYHDGGQDAIVLRRALSDVPATRDLVVLLEEGITLTQGTDYQIDAHPSRQIRRLAGVADNFRARFTAGCRNVKVTYTAETLDGKPDVARVVEEETARAFLLGNNDSTDGGGLVISQRSPDSGDSITYRADDFSEHSMRVLMLHRDGQRFF
jgi:hypothetical protein